MKLDLPSKLPLLAFALVMGCSESGAPTVPDEPEIDPFPDVVMVDVRMGPTCIANGRQGLIEIDASSAAPRVRGILTSSLPPAVGTFAGGDLDCTIYSFNEVFCEGVECSETGVCGYSLDRNTYECMTRPVPPAGTVLTVSDGVGTQTIPVGADGTFDSPLDPTLSRAALSFQLEMVGFRAESELVETPPPLEDLTVQSGLQSECNDDANAFVDWTNGGRALFTLTNRRDTIVDTIECQGVNGTLGIPSEVVTTLPVDECWEIPPIRKVSFGIIELLSNPVWGCIEIRWLGPETYPTWAE